MDKSRIAIITTVSSKDLYSQTSKFFPEGITRYVIDGTKGMHGLHSIAFTFKKLAKTSIKWLIMADEDVIFKNPKAVFTLIAYMRSENISCCGVRDGGEISHRNFSPFSINTFFSILDFEEIKKSFSIKEILKNQYITPSEFEGDLSELKYSYDAKSLYEPYYCFYFWIQRKGFRMLFLESAMLEDNIANKVFTNNGEELLIHTWYARHYHKCQKHTDRINNLIKRNGNNKGLYIEPIILKYSFFKLNRWISKRIRRLKNKL